MTGLRPLGDRVLIRPDAAPTQTASGLHLAEHWKPEQTGTVVAVGQASHARMADVDRVCAELSFYIEQGVPGSAVMVEAANLLRDLVHVEPLVHPGDFVVFSWQVGHELWVNDGAERYLLMRTRDLDCVVGPDVVVQPCEPKREVSV